MEKEHKSQPPRWADRLLVWFVAPHLLEMCRVICMKPFTNRLPRWACYLKLILIALVIASPVAGYIMSQWLRDFAYRTDLSWWIFVLAGGLAIAVAVLTVSYQAIKAALMNPVTNNAGNKRDLKSIVQKRCFFVFKTSDSFNTWVYNAILGRID